MDTQVDGVGINAVRWYADIGALRVVFGQSALVVIEAQVCRALAVGILYEGVKVDAHDMMQLVVAVIARLQVEPHVQVAARRAEPQTLEAHGVGLHILDAMWRQRGDDAGADDVGPCSTLL